MAGRTYPYVIVGASLTGASAAAGIREIDKNAPVLLVGEEKHLPYNRPDLTKKLWFGKKTVDQIFVHDREYYRSSGVDLALGDRAVALDPREKAVLDSRGESYSYEKLLLATGGTPRSLPIPGSDLEGVCYYRYLDDYARIRAEASEGRSALVVGGGFIGSEIAAALHINKVDVTMIFPTAYICDRVFPPYLGYALQERYRERGITVLTGDAPTAFEKKSSRFVTRTREGRTVESDILIVGVGIMPAIQLAQDAGLETVNGIVVNEYLRTSNPDIYAAGDIAFFPYQALGQQMRLEHWDNAVSQGRWAGRNMAGAAEPFTYMPYFFSDLFEFGYEAVGDVDSRLEMFADWQKENDTGVIYYLRDSKVRGVMMCNVWEKVDAARDLIRRGEQVSAERLRGALV